MSTRWDVDQSSQALSAGYRPRNAIQKSLRAEVLDEVSSDLAVDEFQLFAALARNLPRCNQTVREPSAAKRSSSQAAVTDKGNGVSQQRVLEDSSNCGEGDEGVGRVTGSTGAADAAAGAGGCQALSADGLSL